MNVVTTFEDRRRKKQINYERGLLRELSIEALKKSVLLHFNEQRIGLRKMHENLEEACFDVAIEAYLAGGDFSRIHAKGTMAGAEQRNLYMLEHYADTLYHFWLYWDYGTASLEERSTYVSCRDFVDYWWKEGYRKGERRLKLRLH